MQALEVQAMNFTENTTVNTSPNFEGSGSGSGFGDEDPTEETADVAKVIITGAYVIILLFSFVGNSLVIHLVRTRRNIRKNPFNWLLVNTAVADLIDAITASAFALPVYLCGERWLPGILGTILCKLIPFFLVVSICASIWTLTVIATDRYLAIVCIQSEPLSHGSVVRSIIVIWFFAGLIFCGQLYKFNTEELEDGTVECFPEWHEDMELSTLFTKVEMIVRVVITYAVPLVIMAVLYSLIAFHLWTHKPPGHLSFKQRAYARQAKKRRAVIKMMITAITVFAICWLPVHVSHIMSEFYSNEYDAISEVIRWLLYWFAHANAAIHPWLFIVFSEKLRVETKRIFGNVWNRKVKRFRQFQSTLSQQSLGFTNVELTGSRDLAPSRSSLDTRFLSFDTKL